MNLPGKLEFGNAEHIKAVRDADNLAAARKYVQEHWDDIISKNWKWCDGFCSHCGQLDLHGEDPDYEIVSAGTNDFRLRLICSGRSCSRKEIVTIVTVPPPAAHKVTGEQFEIP